MNGRCSGAWARPVLVTQCEFHAAIRAAKTSDFRSSFADTVRFPTLTRGLTHSQPLCKGSRHDGTRYVNAALGAALGAARRVHDQSRHGQSRARVDLAPIKKSRSGRSNTAPSQQMQGGDYSLDPALTAYVRGVGQKLAAVSDRALPYEFVVLNNSVPNAWALPGGKIAVNRGLLTELHSEAELAAVLGHEIVHAAARHGAIAMQRGLLLGAVVSAMQAAARARQLRRACGRRRRRRRPADHATQRSRERARSGSIRHAVHVARRLRSERRRHAAGDVRPPVAAERATRAGSPLCSRAIRPRRNACEKNRATAASLPKGGDTGRERYQAATAALRQRQPAYDAYDKGRAALADNKLADAERFAAGSRAVCCRPKRNSTRCSATLRSSRNATTKPRATTATPSRATIGSSTTTCKKDLRIGSYASGTRRVPSSNAACSCCRRRTRITRSARSRSSAATVPAALENYGRAAQSEGAAGKAAQDATVRLDLPTNPGKYLAARGTLDGDGELVVEVGNPTRIPVADVLGGTIRYADAQGAAREQSQQLTGQLAAGQAVASGDWAWGRWHVDGDVSSVAVPAARAPTAPLAAARLAPRRGPRSGRA